ncbi:MAG TPA: gamma-glutamyl-phosphate reductase, partial [Bacillota bacterium]|nr:gamma-glutamyl-phosphate reductase [Bacillota bacterium]
MSEVRQKGKLAKAASYQLTGISTEEKNAALERIAEELLNSAKEILQANEKDMEAGREKGL